MNPRHLFLLILVFSNMVLGDAKKWTLEIHGAISPIPLYEAERLDRNVSYSIGFSIPFPVLKDNAKFDALRLGLDFTGIPWVSHQIYSFEEVYPLDQEAGKTENLFRHFLIGYATSLSWTLLNQASLWNYTTFSGGVFWAFPALPLDNSGGLLPISVDSTEESVKHKVVPAPFVRFRRPLFKKYPWIVGMAQFGYVPEAGLISSLLVGLHFKSWK